MTPEIYRVAGMEHETPDVFNLTLTRPEGDNVADFSPGQYNMLYHFGFGEVPISISGNPLDKQKYVHTIRAIGSVTRGMQKLKPGDEVGLRGPFGQAWPLSKGPCDVLIVAGGIGIAPLRSALLHLMANQRNYAKITLLYGAQTPENLLYQNEMRAWSRQGIHIETTVDHANAHWRGNVGVVTGLIRRQKLNPQNTQVMVCGPEIMMKYSVHELLRQGVDEGNIHLSLERNMQCSIGFCGHCQLGPYFLCKDGPIFSYAQLKFWLAIKEL